MSNSDYYGGGDHQYRNQSSPQGYNQHQAPQDYSQHQQAPHGYNQHQQAPYGYNQHQQTPHGYNQHQQSPHGYNQALNYPPQNNQHTPYPSSFHSQNDSHQNSPIIDNGSEPHFRHQVHSGHESDHNKSPSSHGAFHTHEGYQASLSHDPNIPFHAANYGSKNEVYPHSAYGDHQSGPYGGGSESGAGFAGPGQQEGERGIGATIVGGATGGLLAHKAGGGLITSVIGSVAGAVGANIIENKLEKHKKHKKDKKKKSKKHKSKSRDIHGDNSSSSSSSESDSD